MEISKERQRREVNFWNVWTPTIARFFLNIDKSRGTSLDKLAFYSGSIGFSTGSMMARKLMTAGLIKRTDYGRGRKAVLIYTEFGAKVAPFIEALVRRLDERELERRQELIQDTVRSREAQRQIAESKVDEVKLLREDRMEEEHYGRGQQEEGSSQDDDEQDRKDTQERQLHQS